MTRAFLLVMDSFGIGASADAASYGDAGADTFGHIAARQAMKLPHLERIGLGAAAAASTGQWPQGLARRDGFAGAWGYAVEQSRGKDTPSGHWEMAGVPVEFDWAYFPKTCPTFPKALTDALIARAHLPGLLGDRHASGTEIIAELGAEHLRTGEPIVYTSGDSVFQIATHMDVVPLEQLYAWCRVARGLLTGEHNVGRVIARPFRGPPDAFERRPERRDFSVPPPGPSVLELLNEAGVPVFAVGKIQDIFDRQGITDAVYSDSNDHGLDLTVELLRKPGPAFVFSNLVDFDSKYGHRNDPDGYASAIRALDHRLPEVIEALDGGVLLMTGDHGCDPTTPPTDHSRERTPLLAAGLLGGPYDIGTRATFGDLGHTVAQLLGVEVEGLVGEGFAGRIGFGT
jgi:phosphopentomutase